MKYIVMRRAVLMEDEGRAHPVAAYETQEEAVAWISKQTDFFTSSDYYITVVEEA